MSAYLDITEDQLKQLGGYWTAKEICQQPKAWQQVCDNIDKQREPLNDWLNPILSKPNLRIILAGAGTSAYVGQSLAPILTLALNRPVEAVSTTEMVINPTQHLLSDCPTLLISFARSGSSPESVAAINLADELISDCHHLLVTCNSTGELAIAGQSRINSYCLTMPVQTLDQSFAMTSSFSSMMLAVLWLFDSNKTQLERAINASQAVITQSNNEIELLARTSFTRVVYLGSGCLQGIAIEAALKMLELTAGNIDCYSESPMGFRHGPKSIVDEDTLIIMLSSHDTYRQRYEKDLTTELKQDNKTQHILQLGHEGLDDSWLMFPYIVFCQSLAFHKSLAFKITPDNPCPSGEVNRVVQGVNIYPLEERK